MPFHFAHMADLHLAARPASGEWTLRRALGYANWQLRRRFLHPEERLHDAIAALENTPLDAVLVSGDIGQLGLPGEYAAAREALAPFTRRGVPVVMVGGNHDQYGAAPIPAWADLCRDLLLDAPVREPGVARLAAADGSTTVDVLLCHQGRSGGVVGSWGEVPAGLTGELARVWRRPMAGADETPPIRLALGHYPLRSWQGRPLSRWYGLRGAEAWPGLFDACGVVGYFCGHLHRRFATDLTATCRQYCAGSVTAGAGIDRFEAAAGRVEPVF